MRSPDRPPDREGSDDTTGGSLVAVGRHAGHGLTIALSTALFAWLGDWVDRRLGTAPLFVLVGAGLGFGAGFYSMYRQLVSSSGEEEGPGEAAGDRPDRDDAAGGRP